MGASKRQKERQRANRQAKAEAIAELGLPEDTKFVDFRLGRKNEAGAKDLTPYFATMYMYSRIREADRTYLEPIHYGHR